MTTFVDRADLEKQLQGNIRQYLPELQELLKMVEEMWGFEDYFYRFYHRSFKVYWLQETTVKIVTVLKGLLPSQSFCRYFEDIVREGTGKTFKIEDNSNWTEVTRPILEAAFHAVYFLKLVIKYSNCNESVYVDSGYAVLLELYNIR